MIDNEANIKRFEDLMAQVSRDGKDELMNYIRSKRYLFREKK